MVFNSLKKRIQKNEGYSKIPYKDQLGYYTIGYGHLIKKKENFFFKNKYNKIFFHNLFEIDFNKAKNDYYKHLYKKNHKKPEKELLIEMVFQIGIFGVLKFKKMLYFLNKKEKYMASLEMLDSLWYKQTPKRVLSLIEHYIK